MRLPTCIVLLLVPGSLSAQHTISIYATDTPRGLARSAHTFAVLDGKDCLSWMPADGAIRVTLLRDQPGRNYTWNETLAWARSQGATVYFLGTATISEASYLRARVKLEEMRTGAIRYRAAGGWNCIDVAAAASGRTIHTGLARGVPASRLVYQHLQRYP